MQVVIINSTGPMGSTSVGSIIEKFDYINIPLRKLGLHEYLVGQRKLDDPFFMDRFKQVLDQHSIERQSGGVNMTDRNSTPGRKLIDKDKVLDYLAQYNEDANSISNIYNNVRNAYVHGLKYKQAADYSNSHIEYTTDIVNFDMKELYSAYQSEFDKVFMVHLHRNFVDWLESLFSQRFIHPKFKTRYFFVFRSAYKQYMRYEEKVKNLPGLHVDFDDLFLPNTEQLIIDISQYIKRPIPDILWEEEYYDLYGKLCDYNTAFTQADTGNLYISKLTRSVIRYIEKKGKATIFQDMVVYGLYLVESVRFQFKYGYLRKKRK